MLSKRVKKNKFKRMCHNNSNKKNDFFFWKIKEKIENMKTKSNKERDRAFLNKIKKMKRENYKVIKQLFFYKKQKLL